MNATWRLARWLLWTGFTVAALPILAVDATPDRSEPPPVDRTRRFEPPDASETAWPNGTRVVVVERQRIPLVQAIWGVRTGSAADPAGRAGTAAMLAELLVGAGDTGDATLREQLLDRGIVLDVEVNRDRVWYSVLAPRERLVWALRRLQDALTVPEIDPERVRRVNREMAGDLDADDAEPERLRELAIWRAAYGREHPYARPVRGTRESLAAITADDLLALHRRQYRPDNMFVVLVGDVRPKGLKALARSAEPKRARRSDTEPASQAAPDSTPETGVVVVDLPASSQVRIAVVSRCGTVPAFDPATLVMDTMLGGSAGSRLYRTLRGQSGHAYAASSRLVTRRDGTFLSAETTVDAANATDAIRSMLSTLDTLREQAPPEEVEQARRHRESSLLALFETNRSIARLLARVETLAVEPSRIRSLIGAVPEVAPQAIVRAAEDCIDRARLSVVVVGDREALDTPLREFDPSKTPDD